MYILKKLNREKRVGTAEESAALQEKGWKLIKEKKPFEKATLDDVSTHIAEKMQENLKTLEGNQELEKDAELEGDQEPEGDTEPESDQEPEGDAEPESDQKTKRTRTKTKG